MFRQLQKLVKIKMAFVIKIPWLNELRDLFKFTDAYMARLMLTLFYVHNF